MAKPPIIKVKIEGLEDLKSLVTRLENAPVNGRTSKAYTERAIAAVLAAKMALLAGYNAGIGSDENEDWDPEWRVVLYVDFPGGQVCWHIAPNDQHLLDGLPRYAKPWDGQWESRDGVRIKKLNVGRVRESRSCGVCGAEAVYECTYCDGGLCQAHSCPCK